MISYQPLYITLIKRNLTKTQLRKKVGFSTATLAKMSKNQYISLEVIDRICKELHCNINDIIQYIEEY